MSEKPEKIMIFRTVERMEDFLEENKTFTGTIRIGTENKVYQQAQFVNGLKHGLNKTYFSGLFSGLQSQAEYDNGQLKGPRKWFEPEETRQRSGAAKKGDA